MRGTFVDGDFLHVSEIELESLTPGDVVVFKRSGEDTNNELTAHRIVVVDEDGICTRGDYNLYEDEKKLDANHLLGIVLLCERKGRTFKVARGFWGLLKSQRIRLVLLTKRRLFSLMSPFYSLLKKTRLVPGIWKPDLKMVMFDSEEGQKFKYTHNGKTVIVRDGDNNIIFRRRPYDLLF